MMALFALARVLDRLGDRAAVDFGGIVSRLVDRVRRRVPRVVVIVVPSRSAIERPALRTHQVTEDQLVWWVAMAVVIGCPLIGLVIGWVFWG
jgi:hypothetical protein